MTNTSLTKVEYRVRRADRFVVTRFEEGHDPEITDGPQSWKASSTHGDFDNPVTAHEVAYALCAQEHSRLGWPLGDERIQYPKSDPRYGTERTMRAKMYVTGHKLYNAQFAEAVSGDVVVQETLTFSAVGAAGYPSDGSDENNSFARYTPSASLTMTIANPALLGQFVIGDTFYLDFRKISE